MNKDRQTKEIQCEAGTSSEEGARRTGNGAKGTGGGARPSCVTSTPVKKITLEELRKQLRKLNLPTTGNKADLQQRLKNYEQTNEESDIDRDTEDNTVIQNTEAQDSERDEDDQEESDDEDEESTRAHKRQNRQNTNDIRRRAARSDQVTSQRITNVITIKDVEGSVSHFSGDEDRRDQMRIERWIDEFEDMSELLQWDNLQKIVYAKKLLRGSAKQFMSLQKGMTTWRLMKKRLLSEFETKHNSAVVHAQLNKRKRQTNETPRQYIYAMQTIASQGDVEEEALIQYIIEGVPDEENNKSILYGADSLTQLRKNMECYDRMKDRSDKKSRKEQPKAVKGKNADKNEKKTNQKERKETRCFSCGSIEHVARDCPHKDEGPKCFKCNQFGHIATKCDNSSETTKKDRKVNVISVSHRVPTDDEITVVMNNTPIISMMDTGTHCTLLRYSEYQRMGSPPINTRSHSFYGLGRSQVMPIGAFRADLIIQGDQYNTEIHVVPDNAMDERMLLGKELTRQMDIRMRGGILSIKKLEHDDRKEEDEEEKREEKHENNEDEKKEKGNKDDEIERKKKEKNNQDDSKEEEKTESYEDDGQKKEKEKEIKAEEDNQGEDESGCKNQETYEAAVRELGAVNYIQVNCVDVDERYRHRIQQLIDSYKPEQGNQTSVETKIILQDETPVCLKPRRLAVKEKTILNAQIED